LEEETMSNIPAPSSGYSDYGYSGGSLRSHFVDDPYGSYGAGDGGYQSADINAYKQQLQAYYQNLMSVYQSLQAGDPRRAQCQQYLQMSLQYAQQVGLQLQGAPGIGNEWDPNAGAMAGGQSLPGTPTYQDSTHCVFDEGNSTSFAVKQSDANTKQFDIYAKDNTLQVPSNAASVSVVQTTEGSDVKWEVTITFPNGTTRKVVYHHVDREGFNLDIQTGDTSQVTKDASVTGGSNADKLSTSELGSGPSSTQRAGDAPTRTEDGKDIYDGASFDISPAPGTGNETVVYASGDVTVTPNSNEEVYVLDFQPTPSPGNYVMKVYANAADKAANKIKDTITIDAGLVDHVSFAGDPTRISYGPGLAVAGHPDQLDTAKPGAGKVTAAGTSITDGMPLDPNNLTDTAPNSVVGNVATYNNSTDVDVHAYYDDAVNVHNITAPGEVTIHGTSFADTMEVTSYSEGPPRQWTIKVYKDGIHDAAHTETFNITGGANTKIKLDVLDIGSVETHGKSGTAANLEAASIQLAGSEPSS